MITIHGDEGHLIRPDGVYRTSVIRSTGNGYQPYQNAQAVAQRFAASDQLRDAPLSAWQKFRIWLASRGTGKATAAIYAAANQSPAQPAPLTSNALVPATPGASLPPSTAAPQYSGQSPDATQMAAMGTYISSGFHPSYLPGVVENKQQAGARVTAGTRVTEMPAELASLVEDYASGRVGQAAFKAAVQRFYAMNKTRIYR